MTVHPVVHIDIPAQDMEKSLAFYRDAFGWNVDTTYPGYPMFRAEGGPGGGFVQIGGEGPFEYRPNQVLIYLQTDDVDASLREVESNGGSTLLPKTEIPGYGWWAVFGDPTGNKIGLYQSTH